MSIYLQGLLLGLGYVAPIGTQNLFVINSAINQPRKKAILTALIVIFFDVTLALACFFGIGALMEALPLLQKIILLVGSLVIIWIGIGLVRSKATLEQRDMSMPLLKVITSACVVTWFNPQAIIDGTMLLGASQASLSAAERLPFVLGFVSASFLWFNGITAAISLFRGKITDKILQIINIVCGCIIIFYGAKLLLSFMQML